MSIHGDQPIWLPRGCRHMVVLSGLDCAMDVSGFVVLSALLLSVACACPVGGGLEVVLRDARANAR